MIIRWEQNLNPAVELKSYCTVSDLQDSTYDLHGSKGLGNPPFPVLPLSHRLRPAPLYSCHCTLWSSHSLGISKMLDSLLELRLHFHHWPHHELWPCHMSHLQSWGSTITKSVRSLIASPDLPSRRLWPQHTMPGFSCSPWLLQAYKTSTMWGFLHISMLSLQLKM